MISDKEKIQMYESYLHALQLQVVACNKEKLQKLISNAWDWSYAHRCGNGEHSDEEQQKIIDRAFHNLTNTEL